MRRDSSDLQWKEVKAVVFQRDPICRLCKVLSFTEFLMLKKKAGNMLTQLDPAHYLAVSARPDLCYESNNICALNHYSHSLLDDFKDPITGKPITEEEAHNWWIRILKGNPEQYAFLEERNLV